MDNVHPMSPCIDMGRAPVLTTRQFAPEAYKQQMIAVYALAGRRDIHTCVIGGVKEDNRNEQKDLTIQFVRQTLTYMIHIGKVTSQSAVARWPSFSISPEPAWAIF